MIHSFAFTSPLNETIDDIFPADAGRDTDRDTLAAFLDESGILCAEDADFTDAVDCLAQRLYRVPSDDAATTELRYHEYGDESAAMLARFRRFAAGVKAVKADPVNKALCVA